VPHLINCGIAKFVKWPRPLIAAGPTSDGHCAVTYLAIPSYQHIRDLLQLGFSNFVSDFFLSRVNFHSETYLDELGPHGLGVLSMAVRDRQYDGLNWCQPHRQCASVVFD
jgi:hypothetical protein